MILVEQEKPALDDHLLMHYGIKGMKWGVRKKPPVLGEHIFSKKCKNGTELTISRKPHGFLTRKLAEKSEKFREDLKLSHSFILTNKDGARVGEASFNQLTPKSLDLEWIGINKQHRRNGYARAVLEGVIDYANEQGIEELTLNATPMGRPLYESLGFQPQKDGTHKLVIPPKVRHAEVDGGIERLVQLIADRIDDAEGLEEDDADDGDVDLTHFGVKGMHWGVRKERTTTKTINVRKKGVSVKDDGSITIDPGVELQRLVRSNGKSMPLSKITYASVLEYDNARYVKSIAGKGIFGGGRDQILSIKSTKKISAPSFKEATKTVSDLMLKDEAFRKANTNMFTGQPASAKELAQIRADPTGKTASAWYEIANSNLTMDSRTDSDARYVQDTVAKKFSEKGYNALRDENDFGTRMAKAPLIIFSPEKSLKVLTVTQVTDDLRKANKETLAVYKDRGKEWLDKELYS